MLSGLERRLGLESASLRTRLAVWYVFFSFVCMAIYGTLLSQYLKYELRASREQTMLKREHRFTAFINTEAQLYPDRPISIAIAHFGQASPDNDVTEVLDLNGVRLFPANDPGLPTPEPQQSCTTPCLRLLRRDGHQTRVLMHQTELAGHMRWLILGGVVDEHENIPNAVREGYFLLLPIVLLGSVAGGFELSRRALLPVGQMTEAAQRLGLSGLDSQLPVPSTGDELEDLAVAWNDLLRRLHAEVTRSTQFTMDASHDLRTSVTVILANAELALRRERTAEEYRERITAIQQESLSVLNLLEGMLLAARSGSSAVQVVRETVALDEIVAEVCDASRAAATIKLISFSVDALASVHILGDRALLRRMFNALLENALKYTPGGGSVSVALHRVDDGMRLVVKDSGIGIDPAHHARIFDRLYQVDRSRSRAETAGSGLGLSIAHWIAETHGMTLAVASAAGAGSSFIIGIPQARLL